ncbi:MAG: carbon-nitrogen family hydrolase [Geobacter sp.]|nr:carbon-nitrogen family hydrolase [Geobacter sp.]
MSNSVKAAAVQFTISLGEIGPNLAHVRQSLEKLALEGVQLAVLPEMWATGFAYKELNTLAAQTEGLVSELTELSAKHRMVIVGSLPEPHGGKVYNSAYVLDNGKLLGKYRKIHLFSLMQEDRSFDSGDSWLLVESSVGKIGVFICYDLRFPELARRLAIEGAEILVVPGEWPKPRQEHWRTLMRARAIENQLFVVAANCCGMTGKLDFFGMSIIIDPKGELLAEAGYEPQNIVATLDFDAMTAWRQQIPCFNDRKPEIY